MTTPERDPILEAAGEALYRRNRVHEGEIAWRAPKRPETWWEDFVDDEVAVLAAAQAKREEIEAAALIAADDGGAQHG